jgi:heterodisulfide reductase subunit D
MTAQTLTEHLGSVAGDLIARCTTCGRCVEVCPVAPLVDVARADPRVVVADLMRLTRGEASGLEARRWTEACNGSGECNAACPEGINVRQWISIAKLRLKDGVAETERAAVAGQQFRQMAQVIRLLASMQMPTAELKRLLAPATGRRADLVFYYGCNVLRSPHIILNVMDILEALGLEFEVIGGAAHCCGVVQFMGGDLKTYERIAPKTYGSFAAMGAKTVVTWCPTCQLQFAETYHGYAQPSFEIAHITKFLASHRDRIAERVGKGRPLRAAIHEHSGVETVVESTRRLMETVPGLQLVEIPQDRAFGYQCSRVAPFPERQRDVHRIVAESAQAAGVELLITVYHGCHRQLCGAEGQYPFVVKNFTDVLAEALGRGREDFYKRYKVGGDVYDAIRSAEQFLRQNGVDVTGVEELLSQEIFGEPGFSGHPGSTPPLTFST